MTNRHLVETYLAPGQENWKITPSVRNKSRLKSIPRRAGAILRLCVARLRGGSINDLKSRRSRVTDDWPKAGPHNGTACTTHLPRFTI